MVVVVVVVVVPFCGNRGSVSGSNSCITITTTTTTAVATTATTTTSSSSSRGDTDRLYGCQYPASYFFFILLLLSLNHNSKPPVVLFYSSPPCCLPASFFSSFSVGPVFFSLSLCLGSWFWPDLMNGVMSRPLQFESLYDGQEVFVLSDCHVNLQRSTQSSTVLFHSNPHILTSYVLVQQLQQPIQLYPSST